MAELKDRLEETVLDPLENAEEYEEYGIDVLSGLLLYGPPGCGKTYLAGALAGELDHSFVEVSPADVTSKWMGNRPRTSPTCSRSRGPTPHASCSSTR